MVRSSSGSDGSRWEQTFGSNPIRTTNFTLLEYILTVENIIIVDLDLKIREDVLHIEICF